MPNPFQSSTRGYFESQQEGGFTVNSASPNKQSNLEKVPSIYTELSNRLFNEKYYAKGGLKKTALVSSDPGMLLKIGDAQKLYEKRERADPREQDETVHRLFERGKLMHDHKGALVEAYMERELEDCTFQPNAERFNSVRSSKQFLEDQKRFQTRSDMNKKRLQEESLQQQLSQQGPYKPSVAKGSQKILQKKKLNANVYDRLYKVGRNAHAKYLQQLAHDGDTVQPGGNADGAHSNNSSQFIGPINSRTGQIAYSSVDKEAVFKPKINKKSQKLKREGKVGEILYNDAKRRKDVSVQKTIEYNTFIYNAPKMNAASKRALASRFIKEFDLAIVDYLEIGKVPKLDYPQTNEFLRRLCFLKENDTIDNPVFTQDKLLFYDMWHMLYADRFRGIHRRNLLVFILAVLGLHYQITKIAPEEAPNAEENNDPNQSEALNPIIPDETGLNPRDRLTIGMFDEGGNFELTEAEVKTIHKIFDPWRMSRVATDDNIGQLISNRNFEDHTYQPEIDAKSRQMCQNYRGKVLEGTAELIQHNIIPAPKDGKITHADLLMLSKSITKVKNERFAE
mmetsp:Transcript_4688/g.3861  ORF Transcript_4688/g.3861 Transcript_4688/m.3861 type:complete len:566 (+) Transcript_4688:475-2172(+)